jgi:predicted  nucleic acid-binding Zn-ribbon protein
VTQKIELTDSRDYELEIQKAYEQLASLEQENRIVTNAEELEELERDIRRLTDQLGSLLLGKKSRGLWMHLKGR